MKKAAAALFLFLIPHLAAAGAKPEIYLKLGQTGTIWSIRFSDDGKSVVTGGSDGSVRLWDLAIDTELWFHQLETKDNPRVFFSRDGKEIYAAARNSVTILDRHTGLLKSERLFGAGIGKIAFISEATKRVLIQNHDKSLEILDLETGESVRILPGAGMDTSSFDFSSDGSMMVTAGTSGSIRLWDLATGEKRILRGHKKPIVDIALSIDGKSLISASEDDTMWLWDVETGEVKNIVKTTGVIIERIKLAAGGKIAVTACDRGSVQLWDMDAGKKLRNFKVDDSKLTAIEVSPDGATFAAGDSHWDMFAWNISTGERVATFKDSGVYLGDIAFSADAKQALLGLRDGTMRFLDLAKGRQIKSIRKRNEQINAVAISPDGKRAVSGHSKAKVKLWDMESGKMTGQYTMKILHNAEQKVKHFIFRGIFGRSSDFKPDVTEVAFSRDGGRVIAGDLTGAINVWDIKSEKNIVFMRKEVDSPLMFEFGYTGHISALAPLDGGKTILAGDSTGDLIVWDTASGKVVKTFEGYKKGVSSTVISSDGKYAATGGWDDMVYLWDMNRASVVKKFGAVEVGGIAFTPDGEHLLTAEWEGKLKLWDVQSGESVREYEEPLRRIRNVAFSQDGSRIVAGSIGGVVAIWD
ncbi:MAG: WD40 repeat domain-containing protein, partial [Nitrospinota bacterium]|nr:WD40 repeat domain-containing protein [Nitrospinota bacterium]